MQSGIIIVSSFDRLLFSYPQRLQENGQTALGPALLIAIMLAGKVSGSKVSRNYGPCLTVCTVILFFSWSIAESSVYKYEKHFQKMYRDVGMAVPKTTETRCR